MILHDQVDRDQGVDAVDADRAHPDTGLDVTAADIQGEPGAGHRGFKQRIGNQGRWVDGEVTVGRIRRDGEVAFAGVQVDGPGAGSCVEWRLSASSLAGRRA